MNFKTLAFSLLSLGAFSQNTLSYSAAEHHYNNGIELFAKKAYSSARKEFQDYISLSAKGINPNKFNIANAEYYSAMSSLYSKALDADIEVERFVLNNSDHPKAKIIFSELGKSYLERGEYKDAIKYLEKSLENRADNLDTYEIRYQLGLAYYQSKDYQNALQQFNFVKTTVISDAIHAAYYAAVINFQNEQYDLALADFKRIENSPTYKNEIPNWIGQILYRQKKYNEFLTYAESIIARPEGRKLDDLILLAAEVSFFNNNFEKAALYYDKAKTTKKGKWTNQMLFKHAFSLYKIEKYAQAATVFKTIATTNDELGQQSAYYLGICALRQNDLNAAMLAFDTARKLDFDKGIKEEASYNYIKVLVEKGNNQQAIVDLQNYIKNYPDGKYTDETNELLSEILFETNNYLSAITYIESLKRTTPKIDAEYQKLTFNQGVVEFNAEKYKPAINYFDKSQTKPINREISNQAKFWKAEALFLLGDTKSENLYRELLSSSDKSIQLKSKYSLAYIYFNNEKYTDALNLFQEFVAGASGNNTLSEMTDDANLRIADGYLAAKNFSKALAGYDSAYRNNKIGKDYALYQKGLVLKYLGRLPEARTAFETFTRNYGNSRLIDEVLLQNGNLAMEAENYASAIAIFTDLLKRKPNSELVPQVLLRRGLAFNNIGNFTSAISDFKVILDKYGKSSFASEAFLAIREALSQAGREEEFFEIAERYKKNNPEGASVQGLQFDTAKDLFFNEKYDKAISAFTNFIRQYPGSVLIPEANYLIAESFVALKNTKEALKYYQEIVNDRQLEFLAQAALRSANIYFENKNYSDAIRNYLLITETTSNQRELIVAYDGLMKSHFEQGNFDQVNVYADKIINSGGNIVVGAENRAELYKAKAFQLKGNLNEAKTIFEKLTSQPKDVTGAEAKYRIGEILYQQKNYDASIKNMQELANNYSEYLEWYENAFLMIADNYIAKNDIFMAKATLNSIIENSEIKDTVEKAKQKLQQLK